MRAFLSLSFFSVGLWALPFSASAEDSTNDVVEVLAPLTLEDLDPDTRSAVVGLATSIAGDRATAATVDDNVAAILALLQSAVTSLAGSRYMFNSLPRWDTAGGYLYSQGLSRLLSEDDWANNAIPSRSRSFVYEIQRALYGQSGVPSSADALLPTVWEISDFLPHLTNSPSLDLSFTNALYSTGYTGPYSIADLAAIQAAFFNGMVSPDVAGGNFEAFLSDYSQVSPYSGSWFSDMLLGAHSSVNAYQNLTRDFYNDGVPSQWATILEGVDPRALAQLEPMIADAVSDGNYGLIQAIQDNGYGIEAALTNLAVFFDVSLRQALTNFWATSADEYRNAQFQNAIASEETQGAEDFEEQMTEDAEDTSDLLDENEPDYEVHFTDNPMTPLANSVDFSSNMRRQMPDVSSIETSSRVYLYKTEWGSSASRSISPSSPSRDLLPGLGEISFDLSGSDPHVPNDLYRYASVIMAWAWNMAAMIYAFWIFKQFWDWVASWRA